LYDKGELGIVPFLIPCMVGCTLASRFRTPKMCRPYSYDNADLRTVIAPNAAMM